jgi:hypothetical protein
VFAASAHVQPRSYALAAYDAAIRAGGGAGFADDFHRFAAASAEWQLGDPALPDVERHGELVPGGSVARTLDASGYLLYGVNALDSDAPLTLSIDAPRGWTGAIALVGRSGDAVETKLTKLDGDAHGDVTVEDPQRFDRLTAVVVNGDMGVAGYRADNPDGFPDWVRTGDANPFTLRRACGGLTTARRRSARPGPARRRRSSPGRRRPAGRWSARRSATGSARCSYRGCR